VPTFKYKGLSLKLFAIIVLTLIGVVIGIVWINREGLFGGLVFLTIFALFISFIFVTAILGISDIIIDANGVSRSLLGHTWQAIYWPCITRIRIILVPDYESHKLTRTICIDQSNEARLLFFLKGGGMFFTETMENRQELAEELNQYITKYKIPVESTKNGVKSATDRI
jgi:hypothetical protein